MKISQEDLRDRFNAFRRQERTAYKCVDYFSSDYQSNQIRKAIHNPNLSQFSSVYSQSTSSQTSINECWREKICEWSYQVVDHFDFNREIVSISLSYLDRYLASCLVNRKIFQLAGMTSLFLAIKIFEPSNLKMSSFIELSRGYFTTEHIIAMEHVMLRALSWHVHPPTPLTVVTHLMLLIPDGACDKTMLTKIKEQATFLTELSVCDYFFITQTSLDTGTAALLAALELNNVPWERHCYDAFLMQLESVAGVHHQSMDMLECKTRLRETYIQGGFHRQNKKDSPHGNSPVCVSESHS